MSRSGYDDGCDGWELIRWRGAVKSAIRGERGRKLLLEMAEALDAMPRRELVRGDLQRDDGVCALGAVGVARKMELGGIDPYDYDAVAKVFGIAPALAREITHINDEWCCECSSPKRWKIVRDWVSEQLGDSNSGSCPLNLDGQPPSGNGSP